MIVWVYIRYRQSDYPFPRIPQTNSATVNNLIYEVMKVMLNHENLFYIFLKIGYIIHTYKMV